MNREIELDSLDNLLAEGQESAQLIGDEVIKDYFLELEALALREANTFEIHDVESFYQSLFALRRRLDRVAFARGSEFRVEAMDEANLAVLNQALAVAEDRDADIESLRAVAKSIERYIGVQLLEKFGHEKITAINKAVYDTSTDLMAQWVSETDSEL